MKKNIIIDISYDYIKIIYENEYSKIYKYDKNLNLLDFNVFFNESLNKFFNEKKINKNNCYFFIFINYDFYNLFEFFQIETMSNNFNIIDKNVKFLLKEKRIKDYNYQWFLNNNKVNIFTIDYKKINNCLKLKNKIKGIFIKEFCISDLYKESYIFINVTNEIIRFYIFKDKALLLIKTFNYKKDIDLCVSNITQFLNELVYNYTFEFECIYNYNKNNDFINILKEKININIIEFEFFNKNNISKIYKNIISLNFYEKKPHILNKFFLFINIIIIFTIIIINIFNLKDIKTKKNNISSINSEIGYINSNINKIKNNYSKDLNTINDYQTITSKNNNIFEILNNIKNILPEKITIINFKYNNDVVFITGTSPNYSEIATFIVNLKNHKYFVNINLENLNDDNEHKTFDLSFKVEG